MTVIELIERLQGHRQSARVVLQGYEGGFDDISVIEDLTIQPASNHKWYYGLYEKADPEVSSQSEHAVLLFGRIRSE